MLPPSLAYGASGRAECASGGISIHAAESQMLLLTSIPIPLAIAHGDSKSIKRIALRRDIILKRDPPICIALIIAVDLEALSCRV